MSKFSHCSGRGVAALYGGRGACALSPANVQFVLKVDYARAQRCAWIWGGPAMVPAFSRPPWGGGFQTPSRRLCMQNSLADAGACTTWFVTVR